MGKIQPDSTLARDGLPLSQWLWRLVDESQTVRRAAGEALESMEWGLPSIHTDWDDLAEFPDMESQPRRFAEGVRRAVADPDFDTAGFIRRLGAYKLAMSRDWSRRVTESTERQSERDTKFGRIADRLRETLDAVTNEAERQRAQDRLERLTRAYICGGFAQDQNWSENAESLSPAGIAAGRIFQILSTEFLLAPEVLEQMLDEDGLRYEALSALERIGPPGISFAQKLFERMDQGSRYNGFDAGPALASIGRGNAEIVQELIDRLRSKKIKRRMAAAQTLEHIGPEVCGREREIVDLLQPLLKRSREKFEATSALASVGRHLPDVRMQILERAGPRPPAWVSCPYRPVEKIDELMYERGGAISLLRYFSDYPDECLPVLIEAMDSFEEFDPDEMYGGPLGRIAAVMVEFGSRAAPAAGPLADHLEAVDEDFPGNILDALAAIGPGAKELLPRLDALRRKYAEQDGWEELPDLDRVIADQSEDRVGWTIQQIRGRPERPTSEG